MRCEEESRRIRNLAADHNYSSSTPCLMSHVHVDGRPSNSPILYTLFLLFYRASCGDGVNYAQLMHLTIMPSTPGLRKAALVLANLLLPVAVLVFASGFFPYKPVLPGLATFDDGNDGAPEARFKRVVFMVVDALRSDFVYGHDSGFTFTQGYGFEDCKIVTNSH